MYRRPHDDNEYGMKVWLSRSEVDRLLDHVDDTTRYLALALGVRCGLRSGEVVDVLPTDVVDGPAGTMLRVREGKGDKYRETPVPPDVATTIRTVADVRDADDDVPLVDVSERTLRRWVTTTGDALAELKGDDGWADLSFHDLRRTWATLLAGADGVDALLVCDWGGWDDLETFLEHYRGSFSPEVQREAREGVDWL